MITKRAPGPLDLQERLMRLARTLAWMLASLGAPIWSPMMTIERCMHMKAASYKEVEREKVKKCHNS